MIDRLKECQEYIALWYLGEPVVGVRMHGSDELTDYCIHAMAIELLRDLIDHPIPESFIEGSSQCNEWIEFGYRRTMHGLSFGFTQAEDDAVKNLAFNYWLDGISRTHANPALKSRLFKCARRQG